MLLSKQKVNELESLALELNIEPDILVDALISIGFIDKNLEADKANVVKLLTPEEKVKAIEEEALNKGWRYEQLWCKPNYKRYDLMGVVCFIDDKTIIGNVHEESIGLIHERTTGEPVINILEKKTTVPKFVYEIYKRLEEKEY